MYLLVVVLYTIFMRIHSAYNKFQYVYLNLKLPLGSGSNMMYSWLTQLCRDHNTAIRLNDTDGLVKHPLPLQNHKDGFIRSYLGYNKIAQNFMRDRWGKQIIQWKSISGGT